MHGELADPVEQRRVRGRLARPCRSRTRSPSWRRRAAKTSLEQVVAADRLDRREQAGRQAVVVGREEVLGVGGDVVQVARPADAVADGLAADEVGRLERPELLEDAGPAGAEPRRELVGRARAADPERAARSSRRRLGRAVERPWPARRRVAGAELGRAGAATDGWGSDHRATG